MSYASVHIDVPPTANRMWRNGNTRHGKSAEYEGWKRAASWDINVQRKGFKFTDPVEVTIIAKQPHALRDLDNLIKPTLDSLQAGCLLSNDNIVRCILARWARETDEPDLKGEKMRVEVRSYT